MDDKISKLSSLDKSKSIADTASVELDSTEIKKSMKNVLSTEKSKSMSKVVSFTVDGSEEDSRKNPPVKKPHDLPKLNYDSSSGENPSGQQSMLSSSNSVLKNVTSNSQKYLENIQEVDEDQDSTPGYYGWDGYRARFQEDLVEDETPGYYGWDGYRTRFQEDLAESEDRGSVPYCIPPWAKNVRKKYGLSLSDSYCKELEVYESEKNIKEKIKNLTKKHSELMIVKRIESKKQLIIEPSKWDDEINTVKMRAKNTRYYLTPLAKGDEKEFLEDDPISSTDKDKESLSLSRNYSHDSMSLTKKTQRPEAKRELSNVLKSLYKSRSLKQKEIQEQDRKFKKEQGKCPKITLSKIREYVKAQSMDPEERKLHEIIKIEKVPSVHVQERGTPSSKYIINVPQNKPTDMASVNIIKIKEKRKLRVHSIEKINENVTEMHYNQGQPQSHEKRGSGYIQEKHLGNVIEQYNIQKKTKTPTETKTFEVTSKITPKVAPLLDDRKEKVLLVQYEKKSKPGKSEYKEGKLPTYTTQLLGVKKPFGGEPGEMYLYGSEAEGEKIRENITKVDDVPPSLKEKVNSIFQELKHMTFKPEVQPELKSSEIQVGPTVSTATTQRPSYHPHTADTATTTKPDVKSVEVQVRQSQLLVTDSFMKVPFTSPVSEYLSDESGKIPDKEKFNEILEKTLKKELQPKTGPVKEEPATIHEEAKETISKNDSLKDEKLLKDQVDEDTDKLAVSDDLKKLDESKADSEKKDDDQEKPVKQEVDESVKEKDAEKPDQEIDMKQTQEQRDVISPEKEEKEKARESDQQEFIEIKIEKEKEESARELIEIETEKEKEESKTTVSVTQDLEEKVTPTVLSVEKEKVIESETGIEGKESLALSDGKLNIFRDLEDIRSYDIDPKQDFALEFKSSSKFLHSKSSIRKRLNWTDDTIYLEENTCPQLIRGLAETAVRRPADPISFLAHWIYKDYHNREQQEVAEIQREHLQLAKGMKEIGQGEPQVQKKFKLLRYPIKSEQHSGLSVDEKAVDSDDVQPPDAQQEDQ